MHNAPKIIWLQVDPNGVDPTEGFLPEGATWCQDQVNATDIKYVRVDPIPRAKDLLGDDTTQLFVNQLLMTMVVQRGGEVKLAASDIDGMGAYILKLEVDQDGRNIILRAEKKQ